MLIPLSVSAVILLLINSVCSVDLNRIKRAPQEIRRLETSYNLNHPPLVESHIPVAVIYDDEEDIHVISKSIKEDETITTENITVENDSNNDTSTSVTKPVLKPKALFANHPPSVEDYDPIPVAIVTEDKEETTVKSLTNTEDNKSEQETFTTRLNNETTTESVVKPKGRSVNFEDVPINTKNSIKKPTKRRQKHRVNKNTVNKLTNETKIEVTDTATENTTDEAVQKEQNNTKSTVETPKNNEHVARNTKFQKRTQQRDPVVPIIDSESYVYAYNGDYHYSYQGGDGTKAFERGELKSVDGESSGTGVVGGYSYKDKDGNDFSLSYTADENGYRPVGAHLPTPPPIPIAIQRALALLATKTTPEPVTEKVKSL